MSGPRIGSLFSGYGGLDAAVQAVLGGTVAWHCENNPAAARLLAHHDPDVPNLGDITAAPWADVEPIDVLTGGFPCQDVSSAGRRAGLTPDSRSGLWTHMARAINVLRPRLVVIENVRGLLSADAACDVEPCPWCLGDHEGRPLRALGAVLGDLAVLGYDARWCGVRAADAGAPHERFRVIVIAWPAADAESVAGGGVDGERELAGGETAGRLGADPDAAELGRWPARRDDGVRAAGLVAGSDADPDGVGPLRCGSARGGRCGPADDGVSAADPERDGRAGRGPGGAGTPDARRDGSRTAIAGRGTTAPDPDGDAVRQQPVAERGGRGEAVAGQHGVGPPAADADDHGREGRAERDGGAEAGQQAPLGGDAAGRVLDWGDYGPAVHRWELILGRPAPAPTMTGRRGGQQLAPAFVEWLMGLPAGHVTDVPRLSRNDQLKLLGNGVVPQQAELALRHLLASETPAKRSDVA